MGKPLVCVTVAAATTAELRQCRDAAVTIDGADLVEVRLDSVSDPDVAGALQGRARPVIVTCRPSWEGGRFRGSEDERRQLLEQALALGAEYVDIEWRAGFDDVIARTRGRRVILSMHDFDRVPDDLRASATAMRATGAQVIKLAVKTHRLADCVPLLDLGSHEGGDANLVVIGMGPHGIATRILVERFGSAWSYAGAMSEIGQVTPTELRDEYGFSTVGKSTAVYGLTGSPISHSVSPAMHNAAFRAVGLDAVYLPLPAADADDFMQFARALRLNGASVTIPFKLSLLERMDDIDPMAQRIGAINTIRVVDGRWIGSNSDADGFLAPLEERGIGVTGMRASILGAGGSARAVAMALGSKGADVQVHARNRTRAAEVAAAASARVGPWPPEKDTWDLLVNCTPIGMHPRIDETPVVASTLTGSLVYDLVYNPPVTQLLSDAARAGCQTIGGLDMLVAQAQLQFRSWTHIDPPAAVMRAAATRRLTEFARDENHIV